jgi:hypothetical protein
MKIAVIHDDADVFRATRGREGSTARARSAHAVLIAFAAVVAWLPSLAAGAAEYDGRYAGLITCDALPGQTVLPLKTAFSITIADGRAEYQREVLQPNSSGRLGVTERGAGTVSPGGELSLTGSAGAQTWNYEATYRGRFDGKSLRLSGTQVWRLSNKAPHSRPCDIAVSRTE